MSLSKISLDDSCVSSANHPGHVEDGTASNLTNCDINNNNSSSMNNTTSLASVNNRDEIPPETNRAIIITKSTPAEIVRRFLRFLEAINCTLRADSTLPAASRKRKLEEDVDAVYAFCDSLPVKREYMVVNKKPKFGPVFKSYEIDEEPSFDNNTAAVGHAQKNIARNESGKESHRDAFFEQAGQNGGRNGGEQEPHRNDREKQPGRSAGKNQSVRNDGENVDAVEEMDDDLDLIGEIVGAMNDSIETFEEENEEEDENDKDDGCRIC